MRVGGRSESSGPKVVWENIEQVDEPRHIDGVDRSVKAEFVILSGTKVLELVQPDRSTAHCHGRIMCLDDQRDLLVLVFPIFHHEALVRMPKQLGPVVDEELAMLRHIAAHKNDWTKFVPDTCVKCRAPRYRVTTQRVVYCEQHWRRAAA